MISGSSTTAHNVILPRVFPSVCTDSERVWRWAATVILILGFGLSLVGLDKSIWLDEAYTLETVQDQAFLRSVREDNHPPLFNGVFWAWSRLGQGIVFMRFPSVFLSVLTILGVMRWMKPYSSLASVLAGTWLTTLPLMLRYSQEIRGYSLLLSATATAFYCASLLTREPGRPAAYAGLALSLSVAVATHFVGILLLCSICVFVALSPEALRRVQVRRLALALMVPVGLFLALLAWSTGAKVLTSDWWMPPITGHHLWSVAKSLIGVQQARYPLWVVNARLPAAQEAVATLTATGLDVIIIFSPVLVSLLVGNWRRTLPFLGAAMSYWLLMILYSVVETPILVDRTALPAMIPLVGFIALQTGTVQQRDIRRALTAGVVLICLVLGSNWVRNDAGKPYERWSEIAAVLESAWRPGDVLILNPSYSQAPLRHYVSLPPEAVYLVPWESEAESSALESDLSDTLLRRKKEERAFSTFVLYRDDVFFRRNYERHERLLKLLESQIGKPVQLATLEPLGLSRYEYYGP